jgi:hypothetical protein
MVGIGSQRDADRCIRCGGFTVVEELAGGLGGSPGWELTVRRCVICGDVVDPLILEHRVLAARRTADRRMELAGGDIADDSLERETK